MTCAKILRSDLGHEFEPVRLAQTNFLVFGNCFRFDSIFFGTPPGWYLTVLFGRMRQERFSLEVPVAQAFRTIRKTNLSNTNIDLKHVIAFSNRDQLLALMVLDDLGTNTNSIATQNVEFCSAVERFTMSEIPPYLWSGK